MNPVEWFFLADLLALAVAIRLLIWALETQQYVLRRRRLLTWRQRARLTAAHWLGKRLPAVDAAHPTGEVGEAD